jgi:acyl phosphate:glycerol-3-phosphate acyltransferase
MSVSQLTWILMTSYLLGCIATGFYLVRIRIGRDVREMGSGNIGARNVGRVLGAHGFWITLVGDVAKGVLAVWIALHFTRDNHVAKLAMLAVVIGHVWPIQLKFRGGKGIATSLGALAICDFHLALIFVGLFALIYLVLRRTTLGGLVAFALLPLASMFLNHDPLAVILISILAGVVLLAHRKNLVEEITLLVTRRNDESKADQPIK